MKRFNTMGQCIPGEHYMVNITEKISKIRELVDAGDYFIINKARQYGKTTTLGVLKQYLEEDYVIIALDFQMLSSGDFADEKTFVSSFTDIFLDAVRESSNAGEYISHQDIRALEEAEMTQKLSGLRKLFTCLSRICRNAQKPLVLMIDEVDSATNNQVFLDFLSQLRGYYLARNTKPTFHSVILAGVYDIKNLKMKIRPETEHDKHNSPWNIAAKFSVDMSFSAAEIAGMLEEYEKDHHTGMEIRTVAQTIYDYTAGYPYLVSAICKMLDEELPENQRFKESVCVWNQEGISEAVKMMLKEDIPLFGSMVRQLNRYEDLRNMLRDVLFVGKQIPFSSDIDSISMGLMFGYLKEKNNLVTIANRIFEMRLLNMFITEAASGSEAYQAGLRDKNQFVRNGRLDMDHVMHKFVQFYEDIFSEKDEKYVENFGREIFLMYLKPIINGVGNSYQESATRTMTRTDVIVDYLGEQFIIELKIWHGQEYNNRGETQLCEYLEYYHKKKGYLLSFNFNKNKVAGIQEIQIGDKMIVEAIV